VKNQERVNNLGRSERQALLALQDALGVTVQWLERQSAPCDAVLKFADRQVRICLEFKRYANAAVAWEMVRRAGETQSAPSIVVAGRTTREARDILRRHHVALFDAEGNAHLEFPGLLIHTEGQRAVANLRQDRALPTRLSSRAGVVAQALLLEPARGWQIMDLAVRAGISTAFAHRVLVRLEAEGVVEASGAGPRKVRRVVSPTALLDLLAEEDSDRSVARARAFRLARNAGELSDAVVARLDGRGIACALTGAAAAARVAPSITAVPVTDIWVSDRVGIEEAVDACGAERVEGGHNLVLAQARGDAPLAFRGREHGIWIVNPFRLYLDLRRDPKRGQEQADRIRHEVIGF
jgi:hypothetical protein